MAHLTEYHGKVALRCNPMGQSAAQRTTGIESDAVESAGDQEFQVSAGWSISLAWETHAIHSLPGMNVSTGLSTQDP